MNTLAAPGSTANIGLKEAAAGDQGTADFLTGLLQTHEKSAWMLRSFVS